MFKLVRIFLLSCMFLPSLIHADGMKPITIALNLAMTGIHFESDQGILRGAQLAVEWVNAQGGILGRPLKLLVTDNQSSMLGAKRAALFAVEQGVSAVIGAGRSSQSHIIANIFQQASIPMITPYSTEPGITQVGDYIFRACFSDDFQGAMLSRFALEILNKKTALVLVNISETYSQILTKNFVNNFQENGGAILGYAEYKNNSMDFSQYIQQIKTLRPELVLLSGYSKRSAWIIKQAREAGIKTVFLGGDGIGESLFKFAGGMISNTFSADHWHASLTGFESKEFIKRYQQKFKQQTVQSTGAALAYDSVLLIAQAIRRASNTEPSRIRDGLSNTVNFKGVTGTYNFDAIGNPKNKHLVMTSYENGIKRLYQSYFPRALAQSHTLSKPHHISKILNSSTHGDNSDH